MKFRLLVLLWALTTSGCLVFGFTHPIDRLPSGDVDLELFSGTWELEAAPGVARKSLLPASVVVERADEALRLRYWDLSPSKASVTTVNGEYVGFVEVSAGVWTYGRIRLEEAGTRAVIRVINEPEIRSAIESEQIEGIAGVGDMATTVVTASSSELRTYFSANPNVFSSPNDVVATYRRKKSE